MCGYICRYSTLLLNYEYACMCALCMRKYLITYMYQEAQYMSLKRGQIVICLSCCNEFNRPSERGNCIYTRIREIYASDACMLALRTHVYMYTHMHIHIRIRSTEILPRELAGTLYIHTYTYTCMHACMHICTRRFSLA